MVQEQKPAILECVVSGKPIPEIKWFKGDTEVHPKHGEAEICFIPETGQAKLMISKPRPEDETIYSVKAINKFGRAECRANLVISNAAIISKPEVLHAPKITRPLPAVIAKRGKPLALSVEFESDTDVEVKWFRNNIEITSAKDKEIKTFENVAELHIPEVRKKDAGKYEIRIQNATGEARSSGSVSVKDKEEKSDEAIAPRFVQAIQPQIVAEGEVVILETTVDSYPTASFQWFFESHPLQVILNTFTRFLL